MSLSSNYPTLRTEKDIGSKNPETTAVSGFCYAIFQGETQKISSEKIDFRGGLELKLLSFTLFCDTIINYTGGAKYDRT